MNLHMTRRKFAITSALATPATLAAIPTFARQMEGTPAATAMMESTIGITSTLDEWTAAGGEGTPVGEMGTMFEFTSPIDGATPVTVGFTEEMASFMEYNFGDQGPGQEDSHAIVAGSIPTESMPGEQFLLPGQLPESSPFTAQVYAMPSSPNSAILSVMALGNLEAEEAQVVSISISLPNADGSDYSATGDPGGIGLMRDEFIAIYGEPSGGGAEVDNYAGVGPDGMDIATARNLETDIVRAIYVNSNPEAPVETTWENALGFVGSSVPEDAVVGQYFTLPSTQNGPIALDTVLWTSPSLQDAQAYKGSVLSMLYLVESEGGRGVQRIDLAMNAES